MTYSAFLLCTLFFGFIFPHNLVKLGIIWEVQYYFSVFLLCKLAMNIPFTSVAVILIPLEYAIAKSHNCLNKETLHLPKV